MRHPVKRLVYVSSVHAIPETEEKATISEAAAFSKENVIGGYASTKAEATQAVLDAVQNGLDAVVVHPSGIVGPYDRGNNHIVQLIQMYISGKLPADSGCRNPVQSASGSPNRRIPAKARESRSSSNGRFYWQRVILRTVYGRRFIQSDRLCCQSQRLGSYDMIVTSKNII